MTSSETFTPTQPTNPLIATPEAVSVTPVEAEPPQVPVSELGAAALDKVENPAEKAVADLGETATFGFVDLPDADDTPVRIEGLGYVFTENGVEMVLTDTSRDSIGAIPSYAA